jgi:hypothetical protein
MLVGFGELLVLKLCRDSALAAMAVQKLCLLPMANTQK